MPIYFNEEQKGWKFDQLTPKEQEVMEKTAEDLMMQMFSSSLLQFALNRIIGAKGAPVDMEEYLEKVDPKGLHEA